MRLLNKNIILLVMFSVLLAVAVWGGAPHVLAQGGGPASVTAVFSAPTTSSPVAMTNDKLFVWVVSPDDDSVYVINATSNTVSSRITVGSEPRSIALDPNSGYAYVANAADNTVSVIQITGGGAGGIVQKTVVTGAEPWSIVISPDGKRVYVANSVQDTITIIKADVSFPTLPTIIGNVRLNNSACNSADADRHFQPRGLAVTVDNSKLYVTRFLSFVKSGGQQGTDGGKEGLVCRLDINTSAATTGGSVTSFTPITLAAQDTGFKNANTNATSAYANQMQSVVIRGDRAFLPNIAASPSGPLKFNVDTMAFVSMIGGVTGGAQTDLGALNLHLGARVPELGKTKLFFANPWAIAFTTQSGAGNAYAVSAASDLLVKLNVDASDNIAFTGGISTTRYIDLNDPANPATSGANAGKNPLGIVIGAPGGIGSPKAYVMNYLSRNVSVVDLSTDSVSSVISLSSLPPAGSTHEQFVVGAEVFYSSRGHFERPAGTTVSTDNRLSSDGWQACASCHFNGWTDGEVWKFGAGPRKSVPLNGTFSPHNPNDQRVLNYSAIFDELQDFELNIRNVSGPGPVAGANDPNHGIIISDTGDINTAPAVVNAFAKPNAGRPQLTVKLPGSSTAWPALDALKEWVRCAVRTSNGALTTAELSASRPGVDPNPDTTGGIIVTDAALGRRLFFQAGCATCHGGTKWTVSTKDFVSPPAGAEIFTEAGAPGNVLTTTQYLNRFLSDIGSFNINVVGQGNLIPGTPSLGAVELTDKGQDGLGKDYNGDGKGIGFNIPSLLGIWNLPPYYHNGGCETLACVLKNSVHRSKGLKSGQSDPLTGATAQRQVVEFLKTLDSNTVFPLNLAITAHDIFLDPPTVFQGTSLVIGANVQLFGTKTDLADQIADLGIASTLKVRLTFTPPGGGSPTSVDLPIQASDFNQNFGFATYSTTVSVPNVTGIARVTVQVDPNNALPTALGDATADNTASRNILVRPLPSDTTPPVVSNVFISDDATFNDNDAIAITTNVRVKIVASDPPSPSPAPTSGVSQFCIVRYYYNTALRRWVESTCAFQPLPAPVSADTFIVNAVIPPFEGTAYAFVWVKDDAGNISRTPGFDVISFIPPTPININRNDVRVFRILLPPGQQLDFTTTIDFGDVDLSAFDGVGAGAPRIAVSANNGMTPETVNIANGTGSNKLFQIEVRAVVNSRFTITTVQSSVVANAGARNGVSAPAKDDFTEMLVSGPPALRTAIDDLQSIYLPIIVN